MSIMSDALDNLETQVTNATTIEVSAVTLINGLAAQILETKGDPAKVTALAAAVKAQADDLAAAVAANTSPTP